jgi:hypothetical protein
MLTEGQVARRLGMTRSSVRSRPFLARVDGRICVGPAYPSWMFGPGGVIPELAFLTWLLRRRMADLDACDWLVRPNCRLDGASPIEWIRLNGSLETAVAALPGSDTETQPRPEIEDARRTWLTFRGDSVTPGLSARWEELRRNGSAFPLGV